jgi:prepilin-type N-terminal cleavage/methylation domain-containing protein
MRGYTMAELMVVVCVIGILSAIGIPSFVSAWRSATLTAGAQELATILNAARQLAISGNGSVCVTTAATPGASVQYRPGGCGSAIWIGPGTTATGLITLATPVQIANDPRITFGYLGGVTAAGVYTVRDPVNGQTRTVSVATSGRITIP